MVLRCKRCNLVIGLREPITNWSIDRTAVCSPCLEKQFGKEATEFLNDSSEHAVLPSTDEFIVAQ
jgi:hypothetical protein